MYIMVTHLVHEVHALPLEWEQEVTSLQFSHEPSGQECPPPWMDQATPPRSKVLNETTPPLPLELMDQATIMDQATPLVHHNVMCLATSPRLDEFTPCLVSQWMEQDALSPPLQ